MDEFYPLLGTLESARETNPLPERDKILSSENVGTMPNEHFILYSKPGCHLCEGLEEKLRQIAEISNTLEVRDITTNEYWWGRYSLEIPVLCWQQGDRELELPRFSPRATVAHIRAKVCGYVQASDRSHR